MNDTLTMLNKILNLEKIVLKTLYLFDAFTINFHDKMLPILRDELDRFERHDNHLRAFVRLRSASRRAEI